MVDFSLKERIMSTLNKNNGTKQMATTSFMGTEEMFAAVKAGTVTKEEFEEWVSEGKSNSWSEGYDESNYQNAMSN